MGISDIVYNIAIVLLSLLSAVMINSYYIKFKNFMKSYNYLAI